MKVSKGEITKEAYEFQLIHEAISYPLADVKDLDAKIKKMQFKKVALTLPPYLYDRLVKATKTYCGDNGDEIVIQALHDWMSAREIV